MPEPQGQQLGIPVAAHLTLDLEALRQTALGDHAVPKRSVALCALAVFLTATEAERNAQMARLLPCPCPHPLRSLSLPRSTHPAIEREAARLSVVYQRPITKAAVIVAATHFYQTIPEDRRPAAQARGVRAHTDDRAD